MRKTSFIQTRILAVVFGVAIGFGSLTNTTAIGQESVGGDLKARFLELCDIAAVEVNSEPLHKGNPPGLRRRMYFYEDSYAIRALAVAYDITGKQEYLDACKQWSDKIIDFQSKMIPKGAYYMNYCRGPGQDNGEWWVADSSSIAMAVLATAVRCAKPADRARYLNSVKSYAKLVIDNYVGPEGGICNGIWSRYDGQWWCSSGVFGSLTFLLYKETGDEQYLNVALGALDWLNRLDFTKVKHVSFEDTAPAVIMYFFEAYAASMPYLEVGTERRKATLAQISKALDWMAKNQKGRGGNEKSKKHKWDDYNSQWGSKFGGLPFLMYVFSRHLPECQNAGSAADQELSYISRTLFKGEKPAFSQPTAFSMMSYAEKIGPGMLYRKSR